MVRFPAIRAFARRAPDAGPGRPAVLSNFRKEVGMLPLRRILTGVVALTAASLVLASAAHALQVGQKAPEFTLVGPEGKQVKLSELLGKGPVVVYTMLQVFTKT